MTGSEVAAQVRFLTKDVYPSTGAFATDANVLTFINHAQNEIASRTKFDISTNVPNDGTNPVTVTVASQRLYSFPTDALELVWVRVGTETLKFLDHRTVDKNSSIGFWKDSGPCVAYYIENLSGVKKYGIYPVPSAGQVIALAYVRKPTALSAIGGSLDVDARLQMAVVYFCCEKTCEGRLKYQEYASYFKALYEDQIRLFNDNANSSLESIPFLGSTPMPSD